MSIHIRSINITPQKPQVPIILRYDLKALAFRILQAEFMAGNSVDVGAVVEDVLGVAEGGDGAAL